MTGHLSAARTLSAPRGRDHPGSAAGPHPARFAARTRIRWENTTAVAVKIKLKRMGKIRAPFYRIIVADARTKRDGRAIEEIGKYHPKAEPSDRKSTRLNSSHMSISYAVFCLKKKKQIKTHARVPVH